MPFRLDGKTALITGAGQGIGRATALLFADAGATVWATDINPATLATLPETIRTRTLDVTDPAAIAEFAANVGYVDVLFHCAGWVAQGDLLQCPPQDWQRSFDLNVTAGYHLCRAFLPAMQANGGGSIILMASVASTIMGVANRAAYSASKAAVIGLTKSIAMDYIRQGIRCNALCPGTADTPSLQERMAATGDAEAARAAFIARQPMGRLGKADEIAAAALYLASDESAFMTGQTIILDGGMSL